MPEDTGTGLAILFGLATLETTVGWAGNTLKFSRLALGQLNEHLPAIKITARAMMIRTHAATVELFIDLVAVIDH